MPEHTFSRLAARSEETLDGDFAAKVAYSLYAIISLAVFVLLHYIPGFRKTYTWPADVLEYIFGVGSFWSTLYHAFLVFYLPFAHYCVGAYGPWVLRRILFILLEKPKLERVRPQRLRITDRIGRRNGTSLWSRAWRVWAMLFDQDALGSVSSAVSLLPADSSDVPVPVSALQSDIDQRGPAQVDTADRSRQRAKRWGLQLGSSMGRKLGATISYPLQAAIRLGEWSTKLGIDARVMISRRRARQVRDDLPGDISI